MKKIISWWFVLSLSLLVACGGGGGGGGGGDGDTTSPTILSTVPLNGTDGVSINTTIEVLFSEDIKNSTLNSTTFILSVGVIDIGCTIVYVNDTVTATPNSSLAYNTSYIVTVTSGVEDLAGNNLATNYSFTFTTEEAPDIDPPFIVSTIPASGETNVYINVAISAQFNEEVDASTINTTTFILKDNLNNPVEGVATSSGNSGVFTPVTDLLESTSYTAMITTGVRDLVGNPLASDYSWAFTTGIVPDTTPPGINSTIPSDGETGVTVATSVMVVFSEEMDTSTINSTTFTLLDSDSNLVNGSYAFVGTTVFFSPSANLFYSTTYSAVVSSTVTDLAGNPLLTDYMWSFITEMSFGSVQAISTTNAPVWRLNHSAVWTGSEMIVWGGKTVVSGKVVFLNNGGIYDPITDSWVATSTTNAPSPRSVHSAVWTGSEMIVWGGWDGTYSNTGGRYDPVTDTWTAMSTAGAPSGRDMHRAIWTGTDMIVWGGIDYSTTLNTGGKYNPITDTWSMVSTVGAPSPRTWPAAVWTGSEMIIWGGYGGWPNYHGDGSRYNPSTDTWIPMSNVNAPLGRGYFSAVWTGAEMIVWGGIAPFVWLNDGGMYDPATDIWTNISTNGAPSGRDGPTAVWTGSEMVIWGGLYNGIRLSTGGKYNPNLDIWGPTPNDIIGRNSHTAIWTGNEMIIWGLTDTGVKYIP